MVVKMCGRKKETMSAPEEFDREGLECLQHPLVYERFLKKGQTNKATGNIMANEGLRGAIFLGIGGTILFWLYYLFLSNSSSPPNPVMIILSFLGFFVLGLGLWLIVEAGIRGAKKNPS
jgi:hypothetical protein